MCRWAKMSDGFKSAGRMAGAGLLWILLATASSVQAAGSSGFTGLGRPATPAEIKAWDIDVRPDLKGLPPGRGTVSLGQEVWESKCASCHGVFGESNEVFTPIIGGTNKEDIKTGHVKALIDGSSPQRTSMMKVSTVSTLWDYINRAMPWNAPKSLTVDQVYGVVAYILNLADVVPEDFELSNDTMAQVQNRLPNRNGVTRDHGLWLPSGKPDVMGSSCMRNCKVSVDVKSALPVYAMDAHGDLSEQNRLVGQVRGQALHSGDKPKKAASSDKAAGLDTKRLLEKNACLGCHAVDGPLVGPAFKQIAKRYANKPDAAAYLKKKIASGGSGVWGAMAMPAQAQLNDQDLSVMADWILKLK